MIGNIVDIMPDTTDKFRVNRSSEPSISEGIFAPGNILVGKYKVISVLGRGGMGCVYRVQQLFLNKELALKTVDKGRVSDVLMRRFQLEAKAAASLIHPNLVQVHDFGLLDDEQPYMVMDLVDGVTLAEQLKIGGPMSLQQIGPLFAQICFGLAYAHNQGVVHRDIKPSNIMLVNGLPLGAEGSVKVVDFGIAKLINTDRGEIQALTRTGEIFGSPLYMSPEQCAGGEVDRRADIYALGCVLFEALTGTPPHVGANSLTTMMAHQSQPAPTLKEASLGKEFHAALEQIVEKMLRKLPAERYQDLSLVAYDVDAACRDGALGLPSAQPISPKFPAKTRPLISISGKQIYMLLALIILVFTATTAGLVGYFSAHKQGGSTDSSSDKSIGFQRWPAVEDYATKLQKNVPILTNAQPIKSTIVIKGGIKKREFVFPECGMGTLFVCDEAHIASGKPVEAKGTVPVSGDVPLTLQVPDILYPGVFETPAIFDKIDPKEFYGLSLIGNPELGMETGESQRKNIAQILKTAAQWPNLNSVELISLEENEKVFDALDTMKGLRNFVLGAPLGISSGYLARVTFLRNLETLVLRHFEYANVADFMPALAGSEKIKRLVLVSSSVTADSLFKLRQCPNLSYLEIAGQKFDDEVVQAVAQLHSLRIVELGEKISMKQIVMLKHSPWIHEIRLLVQYAAQDSNTLKQYYTRQEMDQLKTLDPRIQFYSRQSE